MRKEGDSLIESIEKGLEAARVAQGKKGFNVSVLNVEGLCTYTDVIVLVSASSERQTHAIVSAITEELKDKHGIRPLSREGQSGWGLLDYGDVIVHVFVEESRSYYDLDKMWGDAPRIAVPSDDREPVAQAAGASSLAQRRRRFLAN